MSDWLIIYCLTGSFGGLCHPCLGLSLTNLFCMYLQHFGLCLMFVQFEGNYILEKLICRLQFLYLLNRPRLRSPDFKSALMGANRWFD